MSSSDSRMFEELVARVEALERKVTALAELAEGKDVSGELYGAEADHTADRAERAEVSRRTTPRASQAGRYRQDQGAEHE